MYASARAVSGDSRLSYDMCNVAVCVQMPHPWFTMLQDEEAVAAPAAAAPADAAAAPADAAAGGDVVFPDDYPNSVKHFLMLGAIGMMIGAIVFLTLNFLRSKRSTAHSVRSERLSFPPNQNWHTERHKAGFLRTRTHTLQKKMAMCGGGGMGGMQVP